MKHFLKDDVMKYHFGFICFCIFLIGCKYSPHGEETLSAVKSESSRQNDFVPVTHYSLRDQLKDQISSMSFIDSQMRSGTHIYSTTIVSVGGIEKSQTGIRFSALLDVNVRGSKSQYIMLGASGGATVRFKGRAKAIFKMSLETGKLSLRYEGLRWLKPLTHQISTWTNARIAVAKVHSTAREKASQTISSSKVEIQRTLDQQLRGAVDEQRESLSSYFAKIEQSMHDVPQTTPHIFSDSNEVYFQHLIQNRSGRSLSQPPQTPKEVDSGLSFNEKIFSQQLNRSLKGKTVNSEELRSLICQSFSRFYYKLCESKSVKQGVQLKFVFDNDSPTQFKFIDDKIIVAIKSRVQISVGDIKSSIQDPDEKSGTDFKYGSEQSSVKHLTPAVRISTIFTKNNRSFERTQVEVSLDPSEAGDGLLTQSNFYRDAFRRLVEYQFKQTVPSWFVVPGAPAYISSHSKVQSLGGAFVVMQPQHFTAQNGWLSSFFTYCSGSETQTALGVRMRSEQTSQNTSYIRVTGLHKRTPALKAEVINFTRGKSAQGLEIADYEPDPGLKVGDLIYSVDGSSAAVQSAEAFGAYLAGRSLLPHRHKIVLRVGRYETFPQPDGDGEVKAWMFVDYEVELQKVCRRAQ